MRSLHAHRYESDVQFTMFVMAQKTFGDALSESGAGKSGSCKQRTRDETSVLNT